MRSGSPPCPAAGVGGLQQLVELLGLQCLSVLDDLTGRPQPELLVPIAGGVDAQQPHPHHERQQPSEDHDRERVHRGRV